MTATPETTGCWVCDQVGGPLVRCTVCDLRKRPVGRSAALEMAAGLCDDDCPGYRQEPHPDQLWPGERHGDSMGHADWHKEGR